MSQTDPAASDESRSQSDISLVIQALSEGRNKRVRKFIQRMPKTLHARLVLRARQEGVSMNTLVNTMLAESLGRRESA